MCCARFDARMRSGAVEIVGTEIIEETASIGKPGKVTDSNRRPIRLIVRYEMKLRLVRPEEEIDFIRHARRETILATGGHISPDHLEPIPCAAYLVAYLREAGQPIGMVEFAFHDQVYRSYDDMPYASVCDFEKICPFSQMVGTRTVYVEPDFRIRRPVFLYLIIAGSHIFHQLGARFATASATATDPYVAELYERIGGRLVGQLHMEGIFDRLVSLYVFELSQLLAHKAAGRAIHILEADLQLARENRMRRMVP